MDRPTHPREEAGLGSRETEPLPELTQGGAPLPPEVAGGLEAPEILGGPEVLPALAEAARDEVQASRLVHTDVIQEGGSTHRKTIQHKIQSRKNILREIRRIHL
jgi:hypothetical protein